MKTRCHGCRKLIDYGKTYCDDCLKKIVKNRKSGLKRKDVEATTKSAAWKKVRRKILMRDKCCILCLLNKHIEYKNLQVHHIVKRVDDMSLVYDPKNLITLCRTCHEKCEKMSVKKQQELFKNYLNDKIYDFTL